MDHHTDNWSHCLKHSAISDIGLRRANNQDAMVVALAGSQEMWQQRGHLFIVADGMGAHAAGELASKLAVDAVSMTYSKRLDLPLPEALRTATEEANQQIHQRGQADPEFHGMGTTCTSLLLAPQGVLVAHVGDSRAYRLRGDRFEQLTFDHSLVWEMRAAGQASNAAIATHIPKNIITRSLGPNSDTQVDLEGPFPIATGDTYLLCSDGLSGQIEDDEMGAILGSMPPEEATRALVDLANLRGGPDNITAIVVQVTAPQTAKNGDSTSITPSDKPPARPVHPLLWTLLGVFVLAAALLALAKYWLPAIIGLVGAVITGLIALIQRQGGDPAEPRSTRGQLGKGPYMTWTCPPGADFVQRIRQVVEELRAAATRDDWTVDWRPFETILEKVQAAQQDRDYPSAIREFFRAIAFLLAELKKQRRSGNG